MVGGPDASGLKSAPTGPDAVVDVAEPEAVTF